MIIDPDDRAAVVLHGEPTINDEQRADLHDLYYSTRTASSLARKLEPLELHPDLKLQLFTAKKQDETPLDRTVDALTQIAKIDPTLLEVAERNPQIAKALISMGDGNGHRNSKR